MDFLVLPVLYYPVGLFYCAIGLGKTMLVLSHVQVFVIPWAVACQAPLCMEFCRQEYWSGLLFPSPGELHDPGIIPKSAALQAESLPSELPAKPIFSVVLLNSDHFH